jgi:hypothetical protein
MTVDSTTPSDTKLLDILVLPPLDSKPSETAPLPRFLLRADDPGREDELVEWEGIDELPNRGDNLGGHTDLIEPVQQDKAVPATEFTSQQFFHTGAVLTTRQSGYKLEGILNRFPLDRLLILGERNEQGRIIPQEPIAVPVSDPGRSQGKVFQSRRLAASRLPPQINTVEPTHAFRERQFRSSLLVFGSR